MDDISFLHTCLIYLLPKLIYAIAFLNIYFLVFRPWIIRPPLSSSKPSNSPSPMILSPTYALFQTLYLFLFWNTGLANEPWILLLQIPSLHIWASSMCSLWIDTARKGEYERLMEKDDRLTIETQPSSTDPPMSDLSIPWHHKLLPFILLPVQTAAASDAALILLADRSCCSSHGTSWLEENSVRTYLTAFALAIYIGCTIYSDLFHLSQKFNIPLSFLPSSFPAAREIFFNLASVLGSRANIAYITHIAPLGTSFPLWSLVHLTCNGVRKDRPSDGAPKPSKSGLLGDWKVQLAARVVTLVAAFVAGWFFEKAKEDARIPGEKERDGHVGMEKADVSGMEKQREGV